MSVELTTQIGGWFFLGVFGFVLGLASWMVYARFSQYWDEDHYIALRLKTLVPKKKKKDEWSLGAKAFKRFDLAHMNIDVSQQSGLHGIQSTLKRCGPSMTWFRFIILIIVMIVASGVVIFGTNRAEGIQAVMASLGLGTFGAYQILVFQANRRTRHLLRLFPEVLETMIRAVRAGATIVHALSIVGDKASEPFRTIFRDMSHRLQVGSSLEEALRKTSESLMLDDFRFFSVVLVIQQETGGALAHVLSKLATLIRARQELRLKMHALTSESRTSALIVGCLPLGFGVILQLLSPGHFDPFFYTELGHTLFNGALMLLGTGFFVLWKMTQIKV